jgi:hypothetical protein
MDKMTLSNYYRNLPPATHPKTEFVRRVAERCGVNVETVRCWLRGDSKPGDENHYAVLTEETGGIPKDQLFAE